MRGRLAQEPHAKWLRIRQSSRKRCRENLIGPRCFLEGFGNPGGVVKDQGGEEAVNTRLEKRG